MLDFSEISTDGTQFELLLREILFSLNYHVVWSGVGADGGRDLLVREEIQSIFGRRSFTWLVQCKHFATSGRSVGVRDIDNVLDSCSQHSADGYPWSLQPMYLRPWSRDSKPSTQTVRNM